MGIGYAIDPSGWGANSVLAAFLIKAGAALIDNMGILFALGVGIGMSDDNDGTAALAALVSWLIVTTLLSPSVVALLKEIPVEEVPAAFSKTQCQFIGILTGLHRKGPVDRCLLPCPRAVWTPSVQSGEWSGEP